MRASLFIILLLFSALSFAQVKFALTTGYGTYSMSELKSFQRELLVGFPPDSKITETFPGYLFYEANITTLMANNLVMGGYLNYGSTGGRIHYADYSGEASSNQLVRYFSIGTIFGIQLRKEESAFNFRFGLKPHALFGKLNIDFYSRVGNQDEKESLKFTCLNFGVEPQLAIEKKIKKWALSLFVGYNISIVQGKLFFTEMDDAYLQNDKGEQIHLNFSGLRAGLGISYQVF